jgi:hypothetical protein
MKPPSEYIAPFDEDRQSGLVQTRLPAELCLDPAGSICSSGTPSDVSDYAFSP